MQTYIIAVKREARGQVNEDWATVLDTIDGVEPAPDPLRPDRRQVQATDDAIVAVKEALGEPFHIESVVTHRAAEDDTACG